MSTKATEVSIQAVSARIGRAFFHNRRFGVASQAGVGAGAGAAAGAAAGAGVWA